MASHTPFRHDNNAQGYAMDPWVQSIFQEYLPAAEIKSRFRFPLSTNEWGDTVEQEEEDLVLAARAILEEDDRLSRQGRYSARCCSDNNRQDIVQGAAVTGGLAGLVMGGPVAGLVMAGGAAWTATHHDGTLGDACRMGGAMATYYLNPILAMTTTLSRHHSKKDENLDFGSMSDAPYTTGEN